MFQQSFLQTSTAASSSRRRSTFVAVSVQVLLVAAAIIIPRLYIEALPLRAMTPTGSVSVAAYHPDTPTPTRSGGQAPSMPARMIYSLGATRRECIACRQSSTGVDSSTEPELVEIASTCSGSNCYPISDFKPPLVAVATPTPAPRVPRPVSRLNPGILLYSVQPQYPDVAKRIGQQGTVNLHAIIAADGRISELKVVDGPSFLQRSALDAVSQWRYRPYILNGQPVPVETTIQVRFTLQQQ